MILLFLGPPASGKGTQAELIANRMNLWYFEAGSILRKIAQEKSPLGKKIYQIINLEGKLVPNQIMNKIVGQWLEKIKDERGIIFDGYPRELSQYRALKRMLKKRKKKIDRVIYLRVKKETSIKRIISRRVCPQCGGNYNLITNPPREDELCDRCHKKLIQRSDDNLAVIKKRLKSYYEVTEPLIKYIRREGILLEIDGEEAIESIFQKIIRQIKK